MAIWIVGSGGFVGNHLAKKLQQNDIQFHTASRDGTNADVKLDLLDNLTFRNLEVSESDFVILLAGISSPEFCQENYEAAYDVNVLGTSSFINYILRKGSKVLFASSDTVYGNQEYPIDENHPCVPSGKYGEMKHKVETAFLNDPNFKPLKSPKSPRIEEPRKPIKFLFTKKIQQSQCQNKRNVTLQ